MKRKKKIFFHHLHVSLIVYDERYIRSLGRKLPIRRKETVTPIVCHSYCACDRIFRSVTMVATVFAIETTVTTVVSPMKTVTTPVTDYFVQSQ